MPEAPGSPKRNEPMLAVDYELHQSDAPPERIPLGLFAGVQAEREAMTNRRPGTVHFTVPESHQALRFSFAGTTLTRGEEGMPCRVSPSRSILYVKGPTRLTLYSARGGHESIYLLWKDAGCMALARWTERVLQAQNRSVPMAIASFSAFRSDTHDQIRRTLQNATQLGAGDEPLVLAIIHAVVGRILVAKEDFILASMPSDVPESVRDLLKQVKKDPTLSWSLKDAAALAGYSPFHLSRSFKQMVGYGFPDFVERSRAELAVKKLCETDVPIDDVATQCGFGSTHGLRAAVKEYLGLLPSELRTLPMGVDSQSEV